MTVNDDKFSRPPPDVGEYMVYVMQAYLDGCEIEVRPICTGGKDSGKDSSKDSGWIIDKLPKWNWGINDYRIAMTNSEKAWHNYDDTTIHHGNPKETFMAGYKAGFNEGS